MVKKKMQKKKKEKKKDELSRNVNDETIVIKIHEFPRQIDREKEREVWFFDNIFLFLKKIKVIYSKYKWDIRERLLSGKNLYN